MKKVIFFSGLMAILTSFSGCLEKVNPKEEEAATTAAATSTPLIGGNDSCEPLAANLMAGQNMLAGNVIATNDATNLYVTFNTTNGWLMTGTQLYVGSMEGLPVNKAGNPQIGNFPYSMSFSPYSTSYTYTIPLSTFGTNQCIVIAAHANVVQLDTNGNETNGQTAWSAGNAIRPGGSWATYSVYCICAGGSGSGTGGGGIGGN
jgi:hypothetical protein